VDFDDVHFSQVLPSHLNRSFTMINIIYLSLMFEIKHILALLQTHITIIKIL